MSKNNSSKAQAKHLKNRTKRQNKPTKVVAGKPVQQFDRNYVTNLLMRGQQITGRRASISDVQSLIGETIQVSAATGCAIEVFERIVTEGKVTPDDHQTSTIVNFDRLSVLFNETADIVMILTKDGKLSDVPPELLFDLADKSQDLHMVAKEVMTAIYDHSKLIDGYMHEHNATDASYQQTVFGYAMERMARIRPKYATPLPVAGEEVPAEEADEYGSDATEEDAPIEVNQPAQ